MSSPAPERPTLRQRLVGDLDRVGWWTLPAFLAVGLAGAVMAGALAVVYYSQQVAGLEAETRAGREAVQGAVADVERARDQALSAIEKQVEAVEDELSQPFPIEDVATLGLVLIEARVNTPAPPSATVRPEPPPPPASEPAAGAPAAAQQQPSDAASEPATPASETASPRPTSTPEPEPEPPPIVPRLGVGFAVAFQDGVTFIATSFGLVADPGSRAGVVEEVVVTTLANERVTGVVHSWDAARGLALVRAPVGELPIGTWRPRAEPLGVGDRVIAVGITPEMEPIQVDGSVRHVDVEAVITTLPDIEFLRGSPIVDRTGRVVAVYTPGYQPFGAAAGDGQAMAPVGLFCERMLNGCESLEAEAP